MSTSSLHSGPMPPSYIRLLDLYSSGQLSYQGVLFIMDKSEDHFLVQRMKVIMKSINVVRKDPPNPISNDMQIDMAELERFHQYHALREKAQKKGGSMNQDAQVTLVEKGPIDILLFIATNLDSVLPDHPFVTILSMGRLVNQVWYNGCQSDPPAHVILTETQDDCKLHLTLTHSAPGCTLEDCLERRFESRYSEVTFNSSEYRHKCMKKNPLPTEIDRLARFTLTENKRVLIISLAPRTSNSMSDDLEFDQVARTSKTIVLTKYFDQGVADNERVIGQLMGYIGRNPGDYKSNTDSGILGGHYVSVTKSDPESSLSSYYLSNDLLPHNPQNLGHSVTQEWPAPEILLYIVTPLNSTQVSDISTAGKGITMVLETNTSSDNH